MQPTHIFHADWGTAPQKRWLARATLTAKGRYLAFSPVPVANHLDLVSSIQRDAGYNGCALVGFDFPIGIPVAFGRLAKVKVFKRFLGALGRGKWKEFYNVAGVPNEISVGRPFYPFKPGGKKHAHLLNALRVDDIDDLRRQCEREQPRRRAACPLFWTLGPNQVGKGAIVGWRDVLAPALSAVNGVLIWPFDGFFHELLRPGNIVIAETYPAECYGWFFTEPLKGKGKQEVRKRASTSLLQRAQAMDLELEADLVRAMEYGFPEGDDAFDAVVGLFGMIEVATGRRQPGEPSKGRVRKLEGWILGQAPAI